MHGSADERTPRWMRDLVRSTPQVPLMAPFMVYLLLLPLDGVFSDALRAVGIAIRGAVALYVAWIFRHYYPPMGRAHCPGRAPLLRRRCSGA